MAKIQDIRHRTQRTNGTRNLSQIKYIVRHHSATTSGNFDSFWRHWNGTNGWGTGGYHEIILRDGTVQICYDPHEITNGVGGHNTSTYHICLVGNGSFTAAQEKAWDERIAFNMKRLNIGVNNVKGHREMPGQNTSCPGINMDTVRSRIRGVSTVTKPAPKTQVKSQAPATSKTKSITQMADEVEAGIHGNGHENRRKSLGISSSEYAKVRAEVNRRSGSPTPKAEAKSSPKPTLKKSNLPNATYYVKNPMFNGSGVRAVQTALASVYFYPDKGAKNNGIDGWYGAKTADAVRRFQLMHGLEADGVYGPKTRIALEKARK